MPIHFFQKTARRPCHHAEECPALCLRTVLSAQVIAREEAQPKLQQELFVEEEKLRGALPPGHVSPSHLLPALTTEPPSPFSESPT